MRTMLDNYENVKEYLQTCMFDPELHPEYFDGRIITKHGDFCAYYRVPMCVSDNDDGAINRIVTNHLLDKWDLDVEEFQTDAFSGMWYFDPVYVFMDEPLKQYSVLHPPVNKYLDVMFVLTSPDRVQGAGFILNENLRRRIGSFVGGNFIVIPSSIHEVIITTDSRAIDDVDLYKLVYDTNRNSDIVKPEDVLSDKVQWCSMDGNVMMGLKKAREVGY